MNLNVLLASTSTTYNSSYLNYLRDELGQLFNQTDEILFIPLARPGGISHDDYTKKVNTFFNSINKKCISITDFDNPQKAISEATGIFTGGGNTFLLLNQLYEFNLLPSLKDKIERGCPYLGTSAGSNICGQHIKTTNDMPIVYPPSFQALGVVPYVINPHFIDKQEGAQHQGESRTTRLKEYLTQNKTPVIALPEGSWIRIQQAQHRLKGVASALWFNQTGVSSIKPGAEISQLV